MTPCHDLFGRHAETAITCLQVHAAAIEGSTTFSAMSDPGEGTWPLKPGNYEIRLLLGDGYRPAAALPPFQIVRR